MPRVPLEAYFQFLLLGIAGEAGYDGILTGVRKKYAIYNINTP